MVFVQSFDIILKNRCKVTIFFVYIQIFSYLCNDFVKKIFLSYTYEKLIKKICLFFYKNMASVHCYICDGVMYDSNCSDVVALGDGSE